MGKLLKITLGVICIGILLITFIVWRFAQEISYYEYISSISNNSIRYSLYKERGFKDSAWIILNSTQIKNYKKVKNIKKPLVGYTNPMIILNWNDGCNYDNPKMLIHDSKYLIFERGGLYHSLYNTEQEDIILNYLSIEQEYEDKIGKSIYECSEEYINWKREYLHNRISAIVK